MSRKKKILFILGRISTSTGAFKSLLSNVIELKKNNFDITVIAGRHGEEEKILKKNEINVKVINYYSCTVPANNPLLIKKIIKQVINYFAEIKIYNFIKKNHFDIIHLNASSVAVGARSAIKLNIPLIWHLREFLEEDVNLTYINKNKMIKQLNLATKIIAISEAVKNHFVETYQIPENKISTIYNGISIESPKDKKKLNNEVVTFTFVGRIIEEKGQFDAVKAFKTVVQKYKNVKLLIIGKCGNKKYLAEINNYIYKNELSKNIIIIDHKNSLNEIWAETDIAIVGSKKEGFGRVTAEFMLNKIPVIGTNSGGTSELLQQDRGILYEFGNIEELTKKIIYAIENPEKMKKIADAAQEFAQNNLLIDNYVKKITKIYNKVVK